MRYATLAIFAFVIFLNAHASQNCVDLTGTYVQPSTDWEVSLTQRGYESLRIENPTCPNCKPAYYRADGIFRNDSGWSVPAITASSFVDQEFVMTSIFTISGPDGEQNYSSDRQTLSLDAKSDIVIHWQRWDDRGGQVVDQTETWPRKR